MTLNEAAAILGVTPDTECPRCGDPKEPDAKWCPWCIDWQERYDEAPTDDAS